MLVMVIFRMFEKAETDCACGSLAFLVSKKKGILVKVDGETAVFVEQEESVESIAEEAKVRTGRRADYRSLPFFQLCYKG